MAENNKAKSFIKHLIEKNFTASQDSIPFSRDDVSLYCLKKFKKIPKNVGDIIYSLRYRMDYLSTFDHLLDPDYTWTLLSLSTGQYELKPMPKLKLPDLTSVPVISKIDKTPEHIHNLRPLNDQSLLMKIYQNKVLSEFLEDDLILLQAHHKVNLKDWGQAEIDGIVASETSPRLYLVEVKGYTEVIGWPQIIQLKMYAEQNHPGLPFTPIFVQSHRDWSFSIVQFDFNSEFPQVTKSERYIFTNMIGYSGTGLRELITSR